MSSIAIGGRTFVATALLFCAVEAGAQTSWDFYATPEEWAVWPEYCKARYVGTSTGSRTQFAGTVPTEVIKRWQTSLGDCWGMLHHHCAGLAYLNRSKAERTDSVKRFRLVQAADEHGQALRSCQASNPFSANIATNLAMVNVEQGKTTEAIALLDETIAAHPTYDGAYIAKSILLTRSGKSDASRSVLLQGVETVGDGSAELHYALGLSYANTKEYERAVEHARKAYALGYPLPGLRNLLARAGYKL